MINNLGKSEFDLAAFKNKLEFDLFFEAYKAPLIESIPGSEDVKVTFLYRADKSLDHVVVGQYGLASFSPKENRMTFDSRLDIWHKSYILPNDARLVYAFSPNHSLVEMEDTNIGEENFPDFDFIIENYEKDPKNPKDYVISGKYCCGKKDVAFSILEAENTMQFSWKKDDSEVKKGAVFRKSFESKAFGQEVVYDIYLPPNYESNCYLLVCFDGEAYQELIDTPNILNHLIDEGEIADTIAVFIHNKEPNTETRFINLNSNEAFAKFVGEELYQSLQNEYNLSKNSKHHVVAGSSAGGLASLFQAIRYPKVFGKVLAQSGAFWFEKDGKTSWIFSQVEKLDTFELDIYLDIGKFEVAKTFNKGLRYIDSVRKMRNLLQEKGSNISYIEYSGGHDYISWDKTFVYGLKKLLSKEG